MVPASGSARPWLSCCQREFSRRRTGKGNARRGQQHSPPPPPRRAPHHHHSHTTAAAPRNQQHGTTTGNVRTAWSASSAPQADHIQASLLMQANLSQVALAALGVATELVGGDVVPPLEIEGHRVDLEGPPGQLGIDLNGSKTGRGERERKSVWGEQMESETSVTAKHTDMHTPNTRNTTHKHTTHTRERRKADLV